MAIIVSVAISVSVVFAIAAVYVYMVRKNREINPIGCPVCDAPVPAFRWPSSFSHAFWGGWTCDTCSTELDRNAMKVSQAAK